MVEVLEGGALFVGCARDCADALAGVLVNLERLSSLFAQSAFLFVENDSRDATKAVLRDWCGRRPRAELVVLDGLDAAEPLRAPRLAAARNHYLQRIRTDFRDYAYAVMLDCDEVNGAEIDLDAVRRAIAFLDGHGDCAAVFANSAGPYYDLWALRAPGLCAGDAWEEVCDHALAHGLDDAEAYAATFARRVFTLPTDGPPLPVESAFGGLGIYKVASILRHGGLYAGQKLKWLGQGPAGRLVGWQSCEHVSFHGAFRRAGEALYVLPDLVNFQTRDVAFNPAYWRAMLFEIRRNQLCPCGSGLRYKACHGREAGMEAGVGAVLAAGAVERERPLRPFTMEQDQC